MARGLFLNARESSELRLPQADTLARSAQAGAPGGPASTQHLQVQHGWRLACSLWSYPPQDSVPGAPLECYVSYFTSLPQNLDIILIICVIGTSSGRWWERAGIPTRYADGVAEATVSSAVRPGPSDSDVRGFLIHPLPGPVQGESESGDP